MRAHTCVIRTAFKKAKNQYKFQNNYLLFIIYLYYIMSYCTACTYMYEEG